MTKKITFFHPYFIYGGVEKTNIRLAKYFVEHGYLVEFMALSFSDHLKDEMNAIGITRVSLKAKRTMNAIGEIRKYMVNESKKYQLTFISCQNYANLAAIFARPAKCNNLKLIISERSNPTEFQYGSSSVWKGKLILFLMKHFYKTVYIYFLHFSWNSRLTELSCKQILPSKDIFLLFFLIMTSYLFPLILLILSSYVVKRNTDCKCCSSSFFTMKFYCAMM